MSDYKPTFTIEDLWRVNVERQFTGVNELTGLRMLVAELQGKERQVLARAEAAEREATACHEIMAQVRNISNSALGQNTNTLTIDHVQMIVDKLRAAEARAEKAEDDYAVLEALDEEAKIVAAEMTCRLEETENLLSATRAQIDAAQTQAAKLRKALTDSLRWIKSLARRDEVMSKIISGSPRFVALQAALSEAAPAERQNAWWQSYLQGQILRKSAAPADSAREIEGTLPADDIRRAFVAGAKWWEYHLSGFTMWPSDRNLAEKEAWRRYPNGNDSARVVDPYLKALEDFATAFNAWYTSMDADDANTFAILLQKMAAVEAAKGGGR